MNASYRDYMTLFYEYIKPHKGKFLLLVVILLISSGMSLLSPQIIKSFIDTATLQGPLSELIWLGISFVAVALISQFLSIIQVYLGGSIGWSSTNALRQDLLSHSLKLDMSFHNAHTPGQLVERIDGDCAKLFSFFSDFIIQLSSNMMILMGVILLVGQESWIMAAALAVFSVLVLMVLYRSRKVTLPTGLAEREARSNLFGHLEEFFYGMADIRTNGGTSFAINKLMNLHSKLFHATRKNWIISRLATGSVSMLLFSLGTILTLGISFHLYRQSLITIGTVYLFFHYSEMIFRPLEGMISQFNTMQSAGVSINRIHDLYEMKSKIRNGDKIGILTQPPYLEFKNVVFSYGEEENILDSVSFQLKSNQKLGLLGRTGSGKTTITRLLYRMYEPQSGKILINGTDINEMRIEELQSSMGLVTQDVHLFKATVRDNITLFDPNISDEHILDAMKQLGLLEWFSRLPQGLDSMLQSNGEGLSAGEAQLLSFTRVFLKDTKIIILDEFSSRLDSLTEQFIQGAVERLLEQRTCIIIAHRLSTISNVDEIIILDKGHIVESGCRTSLQEDSSSQFYQLLKTGLAVQK